MDTTYDLNSKDNDADVYENEDKENLPNESFNVVESKVMDSTIVISNNQDKDGGFQTQSQMNDTIVISKEVSSLDNSPANNNSFRRGTFNIIKEPLSSIENSPGKCLWYSNRYYYLHMLSDSKWKKDAVLYQLSKMILRENYVFLKLKTYFLVMERFL